MESAKTNRNENNSNASQSSPAHQLGPRQIRIPSQRPAAQVESTTAEPAAAPLRLVSANDSINILQDFVIPIPATTAGPAKPAARKSSKSKGSIILPTIVVTGLIAFAYLAVNTSVTSFQSAWNRSDYSRSASSDKPSNRFDFQNEPIPGPFAGVAPAWESVKSKLPFMASSADNAPAQ